MAEADEITAMLAELRELDPEGCGVGGAAAPAVRPPLQVPGHDVRGRRHLHVVPDMPVATRAGLRAVPTGYTPVERSTALAGRRPDRRVTLKVVKDLSGDPATALLAQRILSAGTF